MLYDQYDHAATTSPVSQGSTKSSTIDLQVADDFVVPAGTLWSVDRVEVSGSGGGTSPNFFHVRFFRNAGSLPEETAANTALSRPLAPGATLTNVAIDLSPPVSLSAGHYWLSVQKDELNNGQWNWNNRSLQNGFGAAFRNPNSSDCPTWTPRSNHCGTPDGNPDQVFRIKGTETVPSAGGGAPLTDTTNPTFQGKAQASPSTFAVDPKGFAETPVSSVKKGTTFHYSLSEPARVTFTIQRKSKGRRVKRKCRRATHKNRKKKPCTRYTRVGSFAAQGTAGANRKSFSGKIGRKSLKPGRYRALLLAVDAAGNRSKAKPVSFRVVRARKRG